MQRNYYQDSQSTKTMTEDQFDRVVEAILSGKYSWACLLILRFAGYNPLHYIPHRTYNRLMKSYREQKFQQVDEIPVTQQQQYRPELSPKPARKLQDLSYLEKAERQSQRVKGGMRVLDLFSLNLEIRDLNYRRG